METAHAGTRLKACEHAAIVVDTGALIASGRTGRGLDVEIGVGRRENVGDVEFLAIRGADDDRQFLGSLGIAEQDHGLVAGADRKISVAAEAGDDAFLAERQIDRCARLGGDTLHCFGRARSCWGLGLGIRVAHFLGRPTHSRNWFPRASGLSPSREISLSGKWRCGCAPATKCAQIIHTIICVWLFWDNCLKV